jgi:hypothetical protein
MKGALGASGGQFLQKRASPYSLAYGNWMHWAIELLLPDSFAASYDRRGTQLGWNQRQQPISLVTQPDGAIVVGAKELKRLTPAVEEGLNEKEVNA